MLRNYSLKKNREFQFVYRAGKSEAARSCVLIYAKARHKTVKIGFSVSKKVGNAVTRNKIKRRMREAFFRILPQIRPGYSIVFVARVRAKEVPYARLQRDMIYALRTAKLLKEEALSPEAKDMFYEKNSDFSGSPVSKNAL